MDLMRVLSLMTKLYCYYDEFHKSVIKNVSVCLNNLSFIIAAELLRHTNYLFTNTSVVNSTKFLFLLFTES